MEPSFDITSSSESSGEESVDSFFSTPPFSKRGSWSIGDHKTPENRRGSEPLFGFIVTGYSTGSSTPNRRQSNESQSPLLHAKAPELIPNNTLDLAKTQEGSRSLQKIMDGNRLEEKVALITALTPYIKELITDQYGNYTVRAIFNNCSTFQRIELLRSIQGELCEIACHPKGTHPLQHLI
jgi:hypothetical protein